MSFYNKIKIFIRRNWLFLFIIILAFFLRIYRIEELTCFSGDQGTDLLVVKRMIVQHKFTLLGPLTSVFPVYFGPLYYYMILPVLYIFKLDPISISYFMVLLWLGAIIITYRIGEKFINKETGLFAAFLFSIAPICVEYSRISFNPYPTPLFAAISTYSLLKYIEKKKIIWLEITGLSFGMIFQLHYFNILFILLSILFLSKNIKLYLKDAIILFLSFCVGFSPMIAFELRHNLFNLKTLIFSLSHQGMGNLSLRPHYLLAFFHLFFLLFGYIIFLIFQKNKKTAIFLLFIVFLMSVYKMNLGRNHGDSMPEGWNMRGIRKASEIIAQDAKGRFNVASIYDGDTRAHPFRYFIEVFGKRPLKVEDYPYSETLYVISSGDGKYVLDYPVWEITSFLPARVEKKWDVMNGFKVFKLVKKLGK